MKMLKKGLLVLIVFSFLFSCKSTKNTKGNIAHLNSKKIVESHYLNNHYPDQIKAQLVFKYKGKEELPTINASMRLIKDSVIWMSFSKLGFPVGKIMILPDRVLFYEKLNKKYFEGDYRLISKQIGTEMDFNKVQSLFFGKPIFDLKKQKYRADIDNNQYKLTSKKKERGFDTFFWFDPVFFNLTKEEFIGYKEQKKVKIEYTYTNKKESLNLPRDFSITLNTKKGNTSIEVQYRKVEINTRLSFPFKLPENYKEIKLK
jgi:hypothetical protein